MNIKKKIYIGMSVIVGFALTAGSCDHGGNNKKETNQVRSQLGVYLQAQPVPEFQSSQYRQNVIDIETAQADTTATTSFLFNQGVQDPITSCPSIGFPIPSTAQLTNPEGKLQDYSLVVGQMEATGVYTGDSTGTYVICVNAKGEAYASYWEGFVNTVTGPATWNTTTHQVELTGPVTGGFSETKP